MNFQVQKNKVIVDASLRIYPLDAIYGACYVFVDRCYVYIDQPEPKKVKIYLKSRQKTDKNALQSLAGEFVNELLHQVLRLRIAKQTGQMREMVVGRALLAAEPMGAAGDYDEFFDSADYLDDPLGIAVPWEEKYGQPEAQEENDNKENKKDPGADPKGP